LDCEEANVHLALAREPEKGVPVTLINKMQRRSIWATHTTTDIAIGVTRGASVRRCVQSPHVSLAMARNFVNILRDLIARDPRQRSEGSSGGGRSSSSSWSSSVGLLCGDEMVAEVGHELSAGVVELDSVVSIIKDSVK
jgi:hypothetical protein